MNTQQVLIDPSPDREILDFRPLGFHDIVVVGRYNYSSSHGGLEMHSHEGMIEICVLKTGRQVYMVEGKEYTVDGGDVFVTYPGEKHGTGRYPESKGKLYWCLINVPAPRARFLSLAPEDWHAVLAPLLNRRPRKFRGGDQLASSLDHVFALYAHHQREADALNKVNLQNWLLRFLLDVVDCATTRRDRQSSSQIQRALTAIDARIEQDGDVRLKELAVGAGLSLSRFKARFRNEVGIPPSDYIVRRKVEKASQWLLEDEQSITDISYRLNFSSSQYFATVYKRLTGKSPSDVRSSREIPPI